MVINIYEKLEMIQTDFNSIHDGNLGSESSDRMTAIVSASRRPSNLSIQSANTVKSFMKDQNRTSTIIAIIKTEVQGATVSDVESLRKPWNTMQNVISSINVCLNLLAIITCFTVAYLASVQITKSAVIMMGKLTMQEVKTHMEKSFVNTEKIASHVETVFRQELLDQNEPVKVLRFLLYVFGSEAAGVTDIDQIYFASPLQYFYGAGKARYANDSNESIQYINVLKYMSPKTSPKRQQIKIGMNCTIYNDFCASNLVYPDFSQNAVPLRGSFEISNASYTVSQRPFFKSAMGTKKAGWTSIYPFASDGSLGITYFIPIIRENFVAISAIDLTLKSMGSILGLIVKSLDEIGDLEKNNSFNYNCSGVVIWIMEQESMLLVASSTQESTIDVAGNRVLAENSIFPVVEKGSRLLRNVMARSGRKRELVIETDESVFILSSFQLSGDSSWSIVVHVPAETFRRSLNATYRISIPMITFSVLLMSIGISVFVTRCLGRQLNYISNQMLDIANIRFSKGEKISSMQDRFQVHELNQMQQALHRLKNGMSALSKYAPIEVVQILMRLGKEAKLGVEERELSIMFCDIRNFTQLSESLPPADLIYIMSEYFDNLTQIIHNCQGVVDKYIGDGIMAFWNAPLEHPFHAINACDAAIKCRDKLKAMSDRWVLEGYPVIQMRIGVHTGNALVGNFGCSERLNYTCLGDTVNVASRLESLNKEFGTDIIISQTTYDLVKYDFVCRPLSDKAAIAGKSTGLSVFELVDRWFGLPDQVFEFLNCQQ